jgi:hypothetical protein
LQDIAQVGARVEQGREARQDRDRARQGKTSCKKRIYIKAVAKREKEYQKEKTC